MAMALGENNVGAAMNGNVISNLRFADNIAATMESEGELQSLINRIVEESGKMGMIVNIEKTEVQHVGPERVNIEIKIRSQKLKQVQDFVYLGGTVSEDAATECGVMQNLKPIWKAKEITEDTKKRVYESLVLGILLYNSETWTLKEA